MKATKIKEAIKAEKIKETMRALLNSLIHLIQWILTHCELVDGRLTVYYRDGVPSRSEA